jgi:hypothetical protein
MPCRRECFPWPALIVCVLWALPAAAEDNGLQRWTSSRLPLDEMPAEVRQRIQKIVDTPTLYAQGPAETFRCNPDVYRWYLDHPDRAVAAWRKLGARVVAIADRGHGRFGWSDDQGSDVVWITVYKSDSLRVFYATGQIKPGPLVPAASFQAVVVLHHAEGQTASNQKVIRHQADLILHTDSRGAALIARLLGARAPRMAEQYVGQVQMFFAALPWYIEKHPEKAEELLSAAPAESTPEATPRKRSSLLPSRRK